jgi:hypothetical protein
MKKSKKKKKYIFKILLNALQSKKIKKITKHTTTKKMLLNQVLELFLNKKNQDP